ncbi:MAG: hypothetical protein F6K26_42395 [Moorea sp. SIO2I5]|nr:hypothetical protein [Moorena sp. SIO2I5]
MRYTGFFTSCLLPVACCLLPAPCSLKSRTKVPHDYDKCYMYPNLQ